MYVAIRAYSVDPDIYRDLKQMIESEFVPTLRRVEGFVAYYVVATGTDKLHTISVFATREGEQRSTELAAEFVKRNYAPEQIKRVEVDEGACLVDQHAAVPA